MEYPRHYFEDDVREGFYINGLLKRVWGAQMKVLSAIDTVCKKHGIRWFADCGSLLGAIRHGGYIPWDDDMDICMLRDDFEKFMRIAPEELGKEFYVFNLHFDEFYPNVISRINNGHGLVFDKEFLEKYHDCYMPVGVDIFTLDYLSPNDEEEKSRSAATLQIMAVLEHMSDDAECTEEYLKLLEETQKLTGRVYNKNRSVKQLLFEATDDMYSLFGSKEAEHVALMSYWVNEHSHKYPIECFRDTVYVPFEYMEVPVPIEYDRVLKIEYGDYSRVQKAGGVHDYPYYEKLESKLQELVNNYILKYKFDPDDLNNPEREGVKKQIENYLLTTAEAHGAVSVMLANGNAEVCLELLEACQTSAINTGNLIEHAYGEGFSAVSALESYCEGVYELYNAISQGEFGSQDAVGVKSFLENMLDEMETVLEDKILNRKEMVFIPYRADYWDGLDSMWEKVVAEGEYDVSVVPIPFYKKTALGGYADEYYEGEEFPEKLHITDYHDYNFVLRHPDVIVTQQPYDECNYCIGVGIDYYSRVLKKHTDKLVYVTPFILDEIGDRDSKSWKTMDYFCAVPGVVHADKVIVQSEQMRQAYVDRLTEMSGEDYREVWENKIDGSGVPLADALLKRQKDNSKSKVIGKIPEEWKKMIEKPDGSMKKVVLYNLSVASLAQSGERAIDKLQTVLKTFEDSKDEITLIWHANPHIKKTFKRLDLSLRDKYAKAVEKYKQDGWGIFTEATDYETRNLLVQLVDAYYGDPGHESHMISLLKKPVMLQNVDILD